MLERNELTLPEALHKEQIVAEPGYTMQIPGHAIRRFVRFLLPKMQADLSTKKPTQ